MYVPEFPYKGNQIIVASDRLHLHARKDSIFLFAKEAVSLSSQNTINLDASSAVIVDTPNIKLGSLNANQRVILGDLITASDLLTKVSAGKTAPTPELGASMSFLAVFGKQVNKQSQNFLNKLDGSLSKKTFTE
jgi:hypothetical protein